MTMIFQAPPLNKLRLILLLLLWKWWWLVGWAKEIEFSFPLSFPLFFVCESEVPWKSFKVFNFFTFLTLLSHRDFNPFPLSLTLRSQSLSLGRVWDTWKKSKLEEFFESSHYQNFLVSFQEVKKFFFKKSSWKHQISAKSSRRKIFASVFCGDIINSNNQLNHHQQSTNHPLINSL